MISFECLSAIGMWCSVGLEWFALDVGTGVWPSVGKYTNKFGTRFVRRHVRIK